MGCRSCQIATAEIDALRAQIALLADDQRWDIGQVNAEYARTFADGTVYVHCVPAWGESYEEFEARYRRVRKREAAKRRKNAGEVEVTPEMADVIRLPT